MVGGTGSGPLTPHREAGRTTSRVPRVAPKAPVPSPGREGLPSHQPGCSLSPGQGWMAVDGGLTCLQPLGTFLGASCVGEL